MLIDRQTLFDLEIATPEWRGRDLLALIDHTRSAGARLRLRTLLTSPLATAGDILQRQQLLQELGRRLERFAPRDLGLLLEAVEKYRTSSYVELPPSRLRCAWIGWRQPEMMERLLQGLEATARLLSLAGELASFLGPVASEASELDRLRRELRAMVDDDVFRALAKVPMNGLRRLKLASMDERLRRQKRDLLAGLVNVLVELDALHSLARVEDIEGFSYPDIVESGEPFLVAERAFHPLVDGALPTDLTLGGSARVTFLTGPNMAGKTTYLKACGIIAVLAHAGAAVPARRAKLSRFDALFSILATHDSISRGESFFLAEVRRVGSLTDHLVAGRRVLVLADEMFKGTNVLDAFDATELVVRSMANYGNGVFIVSSHLTELADGLRSNECIALMQFDVAMRDGVPVFTYELKPGVSARRLGMFLLEQEGVAQALASIGQTAAASPQPQQSTAG